MKILVLNSGSSSIKFKLYEDKTAVASGLVEKIGEGDSKVELKDITKDKKYSREGAIANHEVGLSLVNELFKESGLLHDLDELDGCGHRVVQGGAKLINHCVVDEAVLNEIQRVSVMAPLHNPAHIAGIKTMQKAAPKVKNVAVFDTAFHSTMPDFAYMYALPYEYFEEDKIRKYGFHGTSHSYVSKKAAEFLGIELNKFNAITAHLGNGASVSAIECGKCVDTSMGFTPLEGLMMGTRCGDIDPAIVPYLTKTKGLNPDQIDNIMNKKSGFLGICGFNDLRDVEAQIKKGDKKAKLAQDMYIYRLTKYIGSYFTILPRTDALIFTAGIGENSDLVRKLVCDKLAHLGFELDESVNKGLRGKLCEISKVGSKVKILIVPTDEEFEIATITENLIK
ncbi:acetate kinase [Campylobacter sp. MIT 97-5078]|uniref:acetate kinase n=1 Tax=Campylobacter sp. MIT 97-5078 TaxID=1548153 RepID=UPI0005147A1E|nr:acetate kinase [Campylobacter sp. MIT 97-5078]KGI57056.1 acetate kinase [Campylobacter sp. MIT 97-5078]TQR28116.1 acetate kinase [Campylobacter sp. MIT 97-5078]